MAYKFQLGASIMSGALSQEGQFEVLSDVTSGSVLYQVERAAGNVSGSGTLYHAGAASFSSAVASSGSITAGTSFIIGAADMSESDLEKLDGITNGTAAANKAVVLDASKNIATIGTVGCGAITSTGASSMGSLSVGAVSSSATLHAVGAATFGGSVAASGSITAGSSFIIGSADLNEVDMEKLDGITNGTAAANKAVVLDASKNIATIGTIGCGAITSTGASSMGSLSVGAVSSSAAVSVVGTLSSIGAIASSGSITAGAGVAAGGAITTATSIDGSGDLTMGTITMTGFSVDADGDTVVKTLSGSGAVTAASFAADGAASVGSVAAAGASTFTSISGSGGLQMVGNSIFGGALNVSGNLQVDGTVVNFPNVAAAALDAADLILSLDSTTKDLQARTRTNFASDLAGVGLSAATGVMALDLNELAAATVSVANDSIAIIDADDSNGSKKESIADLVDAMAGAGLTATDGVLSTDAAAVSQAYGDANATLVEGFNFGNATLTAERVLTLPASPSTNDIVRVKAPADMGGFDLVIRKGANAHRIDGEEQIRLESNGGALNCIFVGSNTWLLF